MNCREFKAAIDLFLEKELNGQDSTDFDIHFTSCEKCRMELESFKKCIDVMRTILKEKNPPENMKDKILNHINNMNIK